MSKRSLEEKTRRHIFILDSDWEFLQEHFGQGADKGITVSDVIRRIIHQKVEGMRAKLEEKLEEIRKGEEENGE